MNDMIEGAPEVTVTDKIGDRFIQAGLLNQAQVERIIELQNASNLRFGEAAVQLGLLQKQQVQAVLSQQFNYATALIPSEDLDKSLVLAHTPFSIEAEHIRNLRAEIAIRLNNQTPIALTLASPNHGEGRSYLAANLAIAFSQMKKRTLLIDADMRTPSQHKLFNINNKTGLSTILAKRTNLISGEKIACFPHLDVLPAGPIPPNQQEILLDPALRELIASLSDQYDVFIVDTPAAELYSDAQTITQQVGACILVGRKDRTLLSELNHLQSEMITTGAHIIGTVYNEYDDHQNDPLANRTLWQRLRKWLKKKQ
jgi:protein-tyrosine kinase